MSKVQIEIEQSIEIEDVFEFASNSSDELGEEFKMEFQDQGIDERNDDLTGLLTARMNDTESFFSEPPDDFDYKAFLLSYKENS